MVDVQATLTAATQLDTSIVKAVDAPVLANTSEVETGSKVNGIYLKVEVATNEPFVDGAIPNVYLMIIKNPGNNLIASSFPAANAVGANDNKRFVIHQEMLML